MKIGTLYFMKIFFTNMFVIFFIFKITIASI